MCFLTGARASRAGFAAPVLRRCCSVPPLPELATAMKSPPPRSVSSSFIIRLSSFSLRRFTLARALVSALSIWLIPSAHSAPGDPDPAFNPSADGVVYTLAVQPDGKIIIGGDFSTVNGTAVVRLARLNADGSLDAAFNPGVNGAVRSVLVQLDGKIVIAGSFTSVGGAARNMLARLNANGTLDAAFDPNPTAEAMYVLAQQPDGKFLVGGQFTAIAGTSRGYLVRFNADGTLDTAFDPAFTGPVHGIAVQPDGKIVTGGHFFSVGGQSKNRLARVNADGTLDTSFTPWADSTVNGVTLLPDDKLLLAGAFVQVTGTVRRKLARLHPDGTLDTSYTPVIEGFDDSLKGAVLQADGKVLISGDFIAVNGVSRTHLARLNADGTLDSAFNPSLDEYPNAIAVQANGAILLGGDFASAGGAPHNRIARLMNDPASLTLSVPDLTRADWLRSGAGPEFSSVLFDLSTDGGGSWTPLGAGVRSGLNWQVTGLSLPATGMVRARGRTHGGQWGSSPGLVAQSLAYPAPEIVIEQPSGAGLADGTASISFGAVPVGTSGAPKGFIIRNTGTSVLNLGAITRDGAHPGEFSVDTTGMSTVLPAGGSTAFGVTLTPAAQGQRSAVLHVASDDGDENPFDIALTGVGIVTTDANLSSLTLSAGTLAPPFTPATTSYSASVGNATTSLTVTPSTADVGATVTVNGASVASGSASAPVSLSVGANTIQTVVTAFNGTTTKTYTVVVTRATPVPGDVDGSFVADTNPFASAYAVATQPDGRIIVAGNFTSIAGTARNYIARLNADGTLDAAFNPNPNASIYAVMVQPDGRIVVGGQFTTIAGGARSNLARLNTDETLDAAFSPVLDSNVWALELQPDGKILIGGYFTTVNSFTHNRLARLNASGTRDSTFTANVSNGYVTSLALQPDGKVVLGGYFTTVGGSTRNRIARVTSTGALDAAFNPNAGGPVLNVAVQPDGKILLGGQFTTVGGMARTYFARVHADGTLDTGFNPAPDYWVQTMTLQADGKILIGGNFTTVAGDSNRWRIARIHASGALDTSFTARANAFVYGLALQPDGAILAAGYFTQIGVTPVARQSIARLLNDGAAQTLEAPSTSQVLWSRGGAGPELTAVSIELSIDGGANWTPLGAGARIGTSASWQLTGLSLPASGLLRARGRACGGFYAASGGLIEQIAPFPAAEIAVEHPAGTNLSDGQALVSHGMFPVGAASPAKTFTIRNTGVAALSIGAISVDGPGGADFAVNTAGMSASVAPGGSTTFSVTFTPGAAGARAGVLHIASADYDENPFDITLAGTGTNPTDANLSALTPSAGTLAPVFSPATTSYTASVGHSTASVTVTPTVADPGATVAVNGNPVASGSASSPVALVVGPNAIPSVVTASNGTTTKTYTLTVTRAAPGTGDVDMTFNPGAGGAVLAAAVQPDGKIIVGGEFGSLGGVAHALIGRIDADGAVDHAFSPQASGSLNANVSAIVAQEDGQIIIGGDFTTVNAVTRNRIARLDTNGALDAGFNPNVNGDVSAIALQPDGKLIIGGGFTNVGGSARSCVARLNANGTLDSGFNPGANGQVHSVVVQADGKILIGGYFNTVAGTARNRIARLDAGGALDTGFNPNATSAVLCLAALPGGGILVGGEFTSIGGALRNYIARLDADGVADPAFNPIPTAPFGGAVESLALQADGRIIFGGTFTAVAGTTRNYAARVHPDGSLDASFNPDASSYVHCIAQQADGRVILGGLFGAVGGAARNGIARIYNDAASQTLAVSGATQALWSRGGAAPEFFEVNFSLSTNGGASWTPLGAGSRVGSTANWQITGLSLPASGQLRARGRPLAGYKNGSRGLIEQIVSFTAGSPDADGDGLLDSWEITHFGATVGHSALDDFDHDGYNELLELALGLSPVAPNTGGLPPVTIEGGYLTMTLTKQTGVTYEVQSAGTLATGQPDSFSATSTTVLTNNATTLKARDNFLISGSARRFLHLKVTASP